MTLGQLADQADLMGQTHAGRYLRHMDELWQQVRRLRRDIWCEDVDAKLRNAGHGDGGCPEMAGAGVCDWCVLVGRYEDITSDTRGGGR